MKPPLRLLLDEHYPTWFAEQLSAEGIDATAVQASDLQGVDDATVLAAAAADRRVVVTEDITTFPAAIDHVQQHVGVIFVHPRRYPRTRAGLSRLLTAVIELADAQPAGLGEHPVVHWIA